MRLWTIHPMYLDPQGLVALWREALLARAVLRQETKGYRHHPQLYRFQTHASPLSAINAYLTAVAHEATSRGYSFNTSKIGPVRGAPQLFSTQEQLAYEWQHLLRKLQVRNPIHHQRWHSTKVPNPHPLFGIVPGPIEHWEKL